MALIKLWGTLPTTAGVIAGRESDGRLTKIATAGYTATHGAQSRDSVSSGNLEAETVIVANTQTWTFGIGTSSATFTLAGIIAGIEFLSTGQYRVSEAGVTKTANAAYAAGDKFKITIEAGPVVKYYRDSGSGYTLIYTSAIAGATITGWYPVYVRAAFNTVGAACDQAALSGSNLVAGATNDLLKSVMDTSLLKLTRGAYLAGFTGAVAVAVAVGNGRGQCPRSTSA